LATLERLARTETGCMVLHGEEAATPLAEVVTDSRLFDWAHKLAR
jgi:hypothetical protein